MEWIKAYRLKRLALDKAYGRPAPTFALNSAASVRRLYR